MKRTIALLLALLLLLPAFALAEGDDKYYNETGFPIVKEPITVTVGMAQDAWSPIGQKGWDYLSELTGINFEVVYTTDSGSDFAERLNIWLSSDDLPDLMLKALVDRSNANKYGEEGYFLDYMQYIDLMPNMAKFQAEHPDAVAMEMTADGKLYGHSKNRTSDIRCLMGVALINQQWLAALNREMPKTIDEFYDTLVAFRDEDPNQNGLQDEIPLAVNDGPGSRILWQIRAAFGIVSCDNDYCLQTDADGKVYLAETTEAYKAYLKYMRKLFDEKLLDNDSFVMSSDEYKYLLSTGNVGVSHIWAAQYDATYGLDKLEFWKTYAMFPGMTSEYNDRALMVFYPYNNGQARVEISAKTQYPEALCRFIDYICYSVEGEALWHYGKEGVDYDIVVNEFGIPSYSTAAYLEPGQTSKVWPVGNIDAFIPTLAEDFLANATEEQLEYMIANSMENADSAMKEWAVRHYDHEFGGPSFLAYTIEENERMGNRLGDLQSYIKAQRVAFITGEADIDADWDTFQETMKAMGLDELLEIAQDAVDRRM